MLWEDSADNNLMAFFLIFDRKKDFELSNLFSGKNKKNISKCRLLPFLPSMLSLNNLYTAAAEEVKQTENYGSPIWQKIVCVYILTH